jgi:ketosteroid isomerase-like protein
MTTTVSTPSGQASKELVMTWFAAGISSPEGLAMITDDFVWRAPESTKHLFGSGDGVLRGPALGELDLLNQALYKDADATAEATNFHFIIAEGDTVVLEFDVTRTLHDGGNYHNQYCMAVHVRDGKIAEVREHTDTLYSDQVIMGTPEKKAAFTQRLDELRAAHTR